MGFFDKLVGALTPTPPEVRVQGRLAKMLSFGEWIMKKNQFGVLEPRAIVTNIGKKTIHESDVGWSAYTADGIKLDGPCNSGLPSLRPGESGEIYIDLSRFDLRKQQPALGYIVFEHNNDDFRSGEEDDPQDERGDDDLGGNEGTSQPIEAKTFGLASDLIDLRNWELDDEEDQPTVCGTILYKRPAGFPDTINSRQLQAVVHGKKGTPLRTPVGFVNSFTLEKNQSSFAMVDLSNLGLDQQAVSNVSGVTISFCDDIAVRQAGRHFSPGAATLPLQQLGNSFWEHKGKILGPFSQSQMTQLADAGLLLSSDRVSQDGKQTWVAAGVFARSQASPSPIPPAPNKPDEWYYTQDGKKFGPVSPEQLKQLIATGQLQASVMVWKVGMETWIPITPMKGSGVEPSAVGSPAPANEWYYAKGGKKLGPFSLVQMTQLAASGQLLASDMVWKEGLGKWIPAQQIKGFFS